MESTKCTSRRISALALLIVVILSGVRSNATTVEQLDLASLTLYADRIVEGRVVSTRAAWNTEHTLIFTYIAFDITRVITGDAYIGPTTIRVVGGAVGDLRLTVPGAPTFIADEHLILFLYDNPGYHIPVVGLGQGKFAFKTDPATEQRYIGNDHIGYFAQEFLETRIHQIREAR